MVTQFCKRVLFCITLCTYVLKLFESKQKIAQYFFLSMLQHSYFDYFQENCIVIPSAACVYAQIIDSPTISSWNTLSPVKVGSEGLISPPKKVVQCPGSAAIHDVQMSQIPSTLFTEITDPFCVFE